MIGRLSSVDAAGVTWRSARANSAASSCTGSASVAGSFGYSSAAVTRSVNSDAVGGDPRLAAAVGAVADLDGDRARRQRAHDVARELRRQHRRRRRAAPDTWAPTVIVRSRSLPVSVSVSPSSSALTPDSTGQHAAPAGHGPAGGAEGLDEGVSLASELHCGCSSCSWTSRHQSSYSRACGSWITDRRRRSGRESRRPAAVHSVPQAARALARWPRRRPPSSTARGVASTGLSTVGPHPVQRTGQG